jgi:Tfp pilus assembly protein FimT
MLVMSILCLLTGISVPLVIETIERSRGLGAARYLAGRMALARARAVSRSAAVALYFQADATGTSVAMAEDGNGNGVRAAEIAAGIDRIIEEAVHVSSLYGGARIALAPDMPGGQAVQLGGTDLLTFTPRGTSSSGSVYVLGPDGTQWVVRVLGVTARARVLRRDRASGAWVHAF